MNNKYDNFYMAIASIVAELSLCNRKKVGSIIVRQNLILSYGFNGTHLQDEKCEDDNLSTYDTVIHSEVNSILKAAKHGINLNNSIMYVTHSPCLDCAKTILHSGITCVYYKHTSHHVLEGIIYLQNNGVICEKI